MMRYLNTMRFTQFVLVFSLAGCGSSDGLETVSVRGTVTYQGKPLTNGTVRFAPVDGASGRIAMGNIEANGAFVLSTIKDGDGVLPGKYKISVTSMVIPEDATKEEIEKAYFDEPAIPKKYFDPQTSGLEETIDNSHSGSVELVIKDD